MQTPHLQNIPTNPGVYLFKDKRETILYIGKAKNLQKRLAQYFVEGSLWKQDMLQKAEKVEVITSQTESEALYLEDNMIKQYQPEYNNLLKADNSYTYIKITKHACPEIFLTKRKIPDGSTYIGPKHNTMELKKLLQYLRQILQRRACKNTQFNQKKVCSDFYFGLCKGRCEMKEYVAYAQIVQFISNFFKGNTKPLQQEIRRQIEEAIAKQHFERAAKLRDILISCDQFVERQTVVLQKPISGYIGQIKAIGSRRVYVVVNLYEGKVIDVIRQKVAQSDYDEDSLRVNLGAQFGEFLKIPNKDIEQFVDRCFESFVVNTSFEEDNLMNDLLQTLQSRYQLKNFPYRMECLDISHLSGGWASAGLSCLLAGAKYPKGYRRYKVKHGGDDYASLEEVLTRRLEQGENLPDLFVLDGGKGQLNAVKHLILEHPAIQFIALGKGDARKKINIGKLKNDTEITEKIYAFDQKNQIKSYDLVYDQADKLLTSLRDESHRFANAYRKKQMSKEWK